MDVEVRIPAGTATLDGNLSVPLNARGMVLFVHGSGSSRSSPRNRFVAQTLNDNGLATLLFDLLTPAEEADLAFRSAPASAPLQSTPRPLHTP